MVLSQTEFAALYRQMSDWPWPKLGGSVGNFLLYDTYLAGVLSQAAVGTPRADDLERYLEPDPDSLRDVAALNRKGTLDEAEKEFIAYWDFTQKVRRELEKLREGRAP